MQDFSVGAVGWKPLAFLLGFVVAFPVLLTYAALWATHSRHYFFAWFVLVITVPLALALLVQLSVVRVRVEGGRLTVGGGLYRESVSLASVDLGAIRPLSPVELPRVLGTRTNGVGMPGFVLGWFRPGHGKKVFATAGSGTALLVPTSGAFDLVVSPVDQAAFVAALGTPR
ncbi:PH (Pleckstrin Homology) domain-containing protein [Tahibacter aquaticus]|uniref:PH (Pleckstrin Homology) domain-containing protein n=1 Tax=Tahibacter aquaticus TaxID=520092 RepID=A0A4R6YQ64_9GAMM|nr:PH domain-containing protein [Tahibacter aquaticus]TDR39779.1 PH (Pleckstrin Homology) domain-containing protein [Tahibacter aquaticus]